MSDISPSLENIDLLINGGIPLNKLNYVAEQAVSADQVLYNLATRNGLLIRWSRVHDQMNKVKLLNQAIPNAAIKLNTCSERMKERSKMALLASPTTAEKVEQKGVQVA